MLLACLLALPLAAQVMVSMQLMSGAGTAPQVGRGLPAYPWNIDVCAAGPVPIPFDLVRINFPEIRLYSKEQTALILATRTARSIPVQVMKWAGYASAGAGLAVQIENTLKRSSSQLGTAVTLGGLAIPLIISIAQKDAPNYQISNPPPDVIALPVGTCVDYTALVVHGTAPVVVGPRRIAPLPTVP